MKRKEVYKRHRRIYGGRYSHFLLLTVALFIPPTFLSTLVYLSTFDTYKIKQIINYYATLILLT